jgi:hypothetical protein
VGEGKLARVALLGASEERDDNDHDGGTGPVQADGVELVEVACVSWLVPSAYRLKKMLMASEPRSAAQ